MEYFYLGIYIQKIVDGLKALHTKKVFHRDVKVI